MTTPVTVFNHRTNDYGVWVPFNGLFYTDIYSIRTNKEVEYPVAIPNDEGWYVPVVEGNPNLEPVRLELGEVVEIALLARNESNEYMFSRWKTDIARRRSHVVEHQTRLHPEEDFEGIRAKNVLGARVEIGFHDKQHGSFQASLLKVPFKLEDGGKWWLRDQSISFSVGCGKEDHCKAFRLVKQLGAIITLNFKYTVSVSELDYLAKGKAILESFTIDRQPRHSEDKIAALIEDLVSNNDFHTVVKFYRNY